jgi:hypothetical protein
MILIINSNYQHPQNETIYEGFYNTLSYWITGLLPSSGNPHTRKHNVAETWSVSVFRRGKGDTAVARSV